MQHRLCYARLLLRIFSMPISTSRTWSHTAKPSLRLRSDLLRVILSLALMGALPTVAFAEPASADPLPRNAVSDVAGQHQMQMGACFMLGAGDDPIRQYKVKIGFEVRPTGKVSNLRVMSASEKLPFVENCLLAEMARWKFPKPKGGRRVQVIYPLTFNSVGDALASR